MGRENAEKVQDALYRIAELASAAQDMQEFYRAIHEVVGELMDARNFFIALYDEERRLINWPYYVDELDPDIPDPHQWHEFGSREARGMTGYVLRTGEPHPHRYPELPAAGRPRRDRSHRRDHGRLDLGRVSRSRTRTRWSALSSCSRTRARFATRNATEDLLAFVGQHVGAALSRARAIEETRQRNAELAVINSVQDSIAGELDQQAIYDLVGEKLREVFEAQAVDIAVHDENAGILRFVYQIERGVHFPNVTLPVIGFRKHVLETRQPLAILENMDGALAQYQNPAAVTGEPSHGSAIFQPLVVGGHATGVISIHDLDHEHAFDDSDQRLLATIAGSLGVALDNAQLVHETRQRNAELALINSVQAALAGELEMQAIYDVVGDKIQEIFDAQGTSITILDEATGFVSFPYLMERGERLAAEPTPLGASGFTKHVLETREPLLINENLLAEAERFGSTVVAGEMSKSLLFVPLASGGRATGVISLENFDREHAFTDADQRLLTTLAGSLSAALENARLVHETRQRNAELALINSVQEALAGELEMQAIYDVVGDRIRDVFDAEVVDIAIYDEASRLHPLPVRDRARRALAGRADRAHGLPQARNGDPRVAAARRERRRGRREIRQPGALRRDAEVGALRAARHRRKGDRRDLAAEHQTGSTRSPSPTSSCSRRLPGA